MSDTTDTTTDADDSIDSGTTGSIPRRGVLAGLAGLGLLSTVDQAAAAATTLEFGGNYTADPGSNYGLRLAPDNARFGFLGLSDATDGRGVVGRARSSSGATIGVIGRSDSSSDNAAGLVGFNDASSGVTYGFRGRSDSTEGRGALGIATADSGNTIGLEGRADSPDGVAVSGTNTASSGTTYGVRGQVNSPDGYGLYTPDDAKVDGDLYTTGGLVGFIDGNLNVFHGGNNTDGTVSSVVMGHSSNSTLADIDNAVFVFAQGATIAGGGFDDGSTVQPNVVRDDYGTVSGGRGNQAGSDDDDNTTDPYATVGGGFSNTASGERSTVGGGSGNTADTSEATVGGGFQNEASGLRATVGGGTENTASGDEATVGGGFQNEASFGEATVGGGLGNTASAGQATVPGGFLNRAAGGESFAAGARAKAENQQTFVWNDDTGYHDTDGDGTAEGLSSAQDIAGSGVTGSRTFHASAQGGFRFITGASSVTYISGGSTGWATTSTRAAKTNLESVDTEAVLDGVADMDISTWEYRDDDGAGQGERHIGPMAEDFHELVDVGTNDSHINSINADGVLFAAVQGLTEKLDEKDERIDELEAETEDLRTAVATKDDRVADLEAENDALRERLQAVEDYLGLDETSDHPAAADD